MIGQIVGNYKIVGLLGEGGMGTVYKALDLMVDRHVAIKILRPEFAGQADTVERFRREAAVLAKLSHPNIANLFGFFRQGNDLFMVMEYVQGRTLDSLLADRTVIEVEAAIPMFEQVLEAIGHAHEMGIVHRDIKPPNIVIADGGTVKVMDFGIARLLGTSRVTRKGSVIGTIEYMSPEHIRGQEIDARCDIYSLGILLYEMLTGHLPFTANNDFELMRRQIEDEPPAPRLLAAGIPAHVEEVILKALRKDPNARWQTVDEFRSAMRHQDVQAGLPGDPQVAEPRPMPVTREVTKRSTSLLYEGQVVRRTFEVERFLGEGAFAEVYRVKHRFLGRQAMKVFKASGVTIGEADALLSEAVLLSRIGHPNIVRVYDADLVDTQRGVRAFFTMEYVAGGTLERFWRSHPSHLLPVATVIDILRQTCRGLAAAHSEDPPIIHRDVKPQNILVGHSTKGLRVWLTDFGLAKKVNPLTLLASSRGTVAFKAPEALGAGTDSCAGDVWAVGTTLYLLLTNRLPFPRQMQNTLGTARWSETPARPPSRFNVDVDEELNRITMKSLAVEPRDRYRNACEMLLDLDAWRGKHERMPAVPSMSSSPEAGAKEAGSDPSERRRICEDMISRAFRMAENQSSLLDAADLLQKALAICPELNAQYQYYLSLWRRGIAM